MLDFVKTLYQNILSLDPDNERSSHWANHTRFFGIASTISGFFTSDRFQAKHFPHEVSVDKLYRSILGRECRGDERSHQVVRFRDGVSICTIINDLVGSEEYKQKAQLGAVPLPDMWVYNIKSICLLIYIWSHVDHFADLYSNGIHSAEQMILPGRCIKTF